MNYILTLITLLFLQTTLLSENNISYIYKDIAVDSISSSTIDWQKLNEPIYRGFDNGVYWFKIKLEPSTNDRVISIPESHISRARLYGSNGAVKMLGPTRYAAFPIPDSEKSTIYYLRVNCLLEARIPIEIKESKSYYNDELIEYTITGIYLGIVLAIILFSLFSYYSFGNRTYLLYVFMVIGMSVNAFYKDGVTAYLFGINSIHEVLEGPLNSIVVIAAIFFTVSYLGIEDQLKKLKIFGIAVAIIAVIANVVYQFTGSFAVFTMIHLGHLLSLTIFLSAGVILWKKSFYARFFVLAYGLPLFFAYDYYISPHFGIKVLDLPLNLYKLGSIIEMIIFTYGIMYQAKQMNIENKEIRQKLIDYTNNLKAQNKGLDQRPDTINELIEKFNFTLKEIEVLKVLSLNKTNKEIAEMQFISENTVKYHIKNILKKLKVKSKEDAKYHYLNFEVEAPS